MSLFGNAGSLLGMFLQNQDGSETQNLAKRADVSTTDFSKIAAVGLPLILQAINQNTQNEEGLNSLNQALKKHEDVKNYQSVEQLTQNVDPKDGDKILGHVFQDKQTVADSVGSTVGISSAQVQQVLTLLAPIVLKYLADRKNEGNLDKQGLQKETSKASQDMIQTLQKTTSQSGQAGIDGAMLGNIFNALTDNKAAKKDDSNPLGMIGNILGLFDK